MPSKLDTPPPRRESSVKSPSPIRGGMARPTYIRTYIFSCILGIINNNGYTLVNAVAADLAFRFDKVNFMSMFTMVLLIGCFLMTMLHSRIAFRFTFKQRIFVALLLQTISYGLLAVAAILTNPNIGFALSLIGTILTGFAQAIGEVNNISRLHKLPATLIGAWGAGTGLAGIIGPLIYSVLIAAGAHYSYVMLGMIITVPIYWLLFAYIDKRADLHSVEDEDMQTTASSSTTNNSVSSSLSFNSIKVAMLMAGGIIANLTAVYFLEYWILTGFLDRASVGLPSDVSSFARSTVRFCNITYNVGVLISRSSVTWFQIRRVWIPTILQATLLVFWALEASIHFIRYNVHPNTMTSIYMAIMLVRREDIPDTHRELCVNLGFAASNLGILLSSLASLLFANTVMKECTLYPQAPEYNTAASLGMASSGYYPTGGGLSVPDLSVFRSTYEGMTDPEVPPRSDYPPGYSGHLAKTKFVFGYCSPAGEVLEAAAAGPPLPTAANSWLRKPPLQRAQIPRPETSPEGPRDQPQEERHQQGGQRDDKRYFHPTSPPFDNKVFNSHHYYCPPAYRVQLSCTRSQTLRRSRSCTEDEGSRPLTATAGTAAAAAAAVVLGGSGYDTGNGIRSSWWPPEVLVCCSVMASSSSPANGPVTPPVATSAEGEQEDNVREIAPFPPMELGDMSREEMEMKVGNSTDFMYLCMFISEFGKGLKFPMARWDFMGLFNDLTKSDIIEGFVKDILLKCLHALSKPVIFPAATTTEAEVSSRIERMIGKLFLEHGFESEILAGIKPVAEMEMDTDEDGQLIVEDPRQLIRFVFGQLFDIPGCLIPSSADNDVPESSSTAISTYIPLRGQREIGRVLGFDRSGNRWWCIRDGEMGMRVWKEESNGNVELAVWEAALLPAIAGSLEDEIARVKSELNRRVTDIKLNRHRNEEEPKKRKRGKDDDDDEDDVVLCIACGKEVCYPKGPTRKRSSVKAKDHSPTTAGPMECPECSGPIHASCLRCYGCGGKSQKIQEDLAMTSGPATSTSGPMRCPNCHQLALARILKDLAEHVDQEIKAAERRGRRIAMKEKQEALAAARYAEALADAPGRRERKRVDYTSKAYDREINRALRRSEHPGSIEDEDDDEIMVGGRGSRSSRREAQNLSREARLARRHEHQEQIAMGDAVTQAEALGSRTTLGGQRRSARVRTQRPGASRPLSESSSGESDGESESSSSSSISQDGDYVEGDDEDDEDVRASEVEEDDESDAEEEGGEGGIAADVRREHRLRREEELADIGGRVGGIEPSLTSSNSSSSSRSSSDLSSSSSSSSSSSRSSTE
ncbi:hypothetical protein FOL47_010651 [Perkinsus chesapeaki]|uniref:Uncharacterized protein n=1 Tax=Perkinsus chesapeaki TaxID=330153 RepID=A0A7J6L2X1_PERCH|nr:hypothetical protein FOL47_010651 [Perkinsus chesapeaki]